jgi:hypothetical protein
MLGSFPVIPTAIVVSLDGIICGSRWSNGMCAVQLLVPWGVWWRGLDRGTTRATEAVALNKHYSCSSPTRFEHHHHGGARLCCRCV